MSKIDERIANINKFAEISKQKETEEKETLAKEIQRLKSEVRTLKPRIDDLIQVGNACLKANLPLVGMSNSWSHETGFVIKDNILKVGKIGGGAYTWNLVTDGDEIDVRGKTEKDIINVLTYFLKEFYNFEDVFYTYVDQLNNQ